MSAFTGRTHVHPFPAFAAAALFRRGGAGLASLAVLSLLAGCGEVSDASGAAEAGPCPSGGAGLQLPEGFCAVVVAEQLGPARHLAVAPNGDVYVAVANGRSGTGGVVALRDTTGDGRADVVRRFGGEGGTGVRLRGTELYASSDRAVVRYHREPGQLVPAAAPDTIVAGLPGAPPHAAKSLALRGDTLFVNVGAPSNACQEQDRQPGSPGIDPCPQLADRAGIWAFSLSGTGQRQEDGIRYATGLRNTVALATGPPEGGLYGVVHGRDQLSGNWSKLYTDAQGAELPAEEFVRIRRGEDYGWPYCYFDPQAEENVLAPEYGGDGRKTGRCASTSQPLKGFPAHWAPDGLLFYTGDQFPERYRGGAFIAFHGSWNRAPLPQQGYKVVFQPMANGQPTGESSTFADGFTGGDRSPGGAEHRPTGLAQGPDGSLYIADDQGGTVWKVSYRAGS